jgi:hypothetical protein
MAVREGCTPVGEVFMAVGEVSMAVGEVFMAAGEATGNRAFHIS